jgi:hypothetical protein
MGFSPEQKNLIQGLKAFGCNEMRGLVIMARLDSLEKVETMRRYMVANPESTPEELYKVSSRISAKRGDLPEIDEEEDEDAY